MTSRNQYNYKKYMKNFMNLKFMGMFFVLFALTLVAASCGKSTKGNIYVNVANSTASTANSTASTANSATARPTPSELDEEIYGVLVKGMRAVISAGCKKKQLSEKECEKLIDAEIDKKRQENMKVAVGLNENCETSNLSKNDCNKSKENFIRKTEALYKLPTHAGALPTAVPHTTNRESNITSARYLECVRQRTLAELDTSPCSVWASER
jgi:hypothetical protein